MNQKRRKNCLFIDCTYLWWYKVPCCFITFQPTFSRAHSNTISSLV